MASLSSRGYLLKSLPAVIRSTLRWHWPFFFHDSFIASFCDWKSFSSLNPNYNCLLHSITRLLRFGIFGRVLHLPWKCYYVFWTADYSRGFQFPFGVSFDPLMTEFWVQKVNPFLPCTLCGDMSWNDLSRVYIRLWSNYNRIKFEIGWHQLTTVLDYNWITTTSNNPFGAVWSNYSAW